MASRNSFGWQVSYLIKDKAFEKLFKLKDAHYSALLVVEFFLTMIIVAGIGLYLDGRFNTLEAPFNLFIFAAIIYAVLHFYNYTSAFRKNRYDSIRRNSSLKATVLEIVILFVIIISAQIYNDQGLHTLPYPFNLLLFLVVLAIPLYFYVEEKFLKA